MRRADKNSHECKQSPIRKLIKLSEKSMTPRRFNNLLRCLSNDNFSFPPSPPKVAHKRSFRVCCDFVESCTTTFQVIFCPKMFDSQNAVAALFLLDEVFVSSCWSFTSTKTAGACPCRRGGGEGVFVPKHWG